jgi:hypothetical protein
VQIGLLGSGKIRAPPLCELAQILPYEYVMITTGAKKIVLHKNNNNMTQSHAPLGRVHKLHSTATH